MRATATLPKPRRRRRAAVDSAAMNQRLEIHVSRPGLHDVTAQVAEVVRASGVADGLCTVFVQHTSASVVITEGADPAVCKDLEAWSERIAPEGEGLYEHQEEGP